MSAESMANFRAKVAGSSALQVSLTEAIKTGPDAIIALGAANGCDLDANDIQTAASAKDLTDFELGLVSGGGIWSDFKDGLKDKLGKSHRK